jgi:RNA polymerase sigma-70 factor (ECF subfamily)
MLSQYQGILHKVCLIYFRDENDRKDNFQEIVYQMWKSYPNLSDKDRIASWIYAVSINTSVNKIRIDSRIEFRNTLPEPAGFDDMEMQMDNDEDILLLLEAIHKMDIIDKSIILLYLEEKNYDEISEILGISKSNVGTRLSRAKEKLRKNLNIR